MGEPTLDDEILRFYTSEYDEDGRIRSGIRQLELIRTREIVSSRLPARRAKILDIGGAGGVHAEWLVDDGHDVTLIDPVPRHVEQATGRLGNLSGFSAELGDARDLGYDDGEFDAVLLLGPLYHLVDRSDRLRAWGEARRVVRPGGIVFAVAVSRFAELSVGVGRGLIFDEDFWSMMLRTLSDGQHRSPKSKAFFTKAFYHHPDDFEGEAVEAGFEVREFLNIEGFAEPVQALEQHWDDSKKRSRILEASRLTESEPALRGLGVHMMIVAVRPE